MTVALQNKCWLLALVSLCLYSAPSFAEDEFPGRKLYLAAPYIEINDLAEHFADYSIVDVRSPYEFSILHIKGAVNIPLSSKSFIQDIKKLQKTDKRPSVMYCNGKSCMKSYKAVTKCRSKKITNVIAYDRGIMDWAKTFPDKTVLLDVTPVDTTKLISKIDFQKHLLEPETFELNIAETEPLVLDIRDITQREGLTLFIGLESTVNINDQQTIEKYIKLSNKTKKPLYIYDMAGKQVRWLQYQLEHHNAKSYYFMSGGARKYFKNMQDQYMHKN